MKNSLLTLEKLKAQQEKLKARIQLTEARLKTSERKKETRQKILLGSYYLDKAKKENEWESVKKIMNEFLKRDNDRAVFELSPLNKNQASE